MFLFQFVKHIIETVIDIYEILLIWWVDPQYPWSQGIGSPIWGSSMTVPTTLFFQVLCKAIHNSKVILKNILNLDKTFIQTPGLDANSEAMAPGQKKFPKAATGQ